MKYIWRVERAKVEENVYFCRNFGLISSRRMLPNSNIPQCIMGWPEQSNNTINNLFSILSHLGKNNSSNGMRKITKQSNIMTF